MGWNSPRPYRSGGTCACAMIRTCGRRPLPRPPAGISTACCPRATTAALAAHHQRGADAPARPFVQRGAGSAGRAAGQQRMAVGRGRVPAVARDAPYGAVWT
jgi:hypothetical protein